MNNNEFKEWEEDKSTINYSIASVLSTYVAGDDNDDEDDEDEHVLRNCVLNTK